MSVKQATDVMVASFEGNFQSGVAVLKMKNVQGQVFVIFESTYHIDSS